MRLISAQISGIGRLREMRVNLDRKLIAVVGPNEAGKTTFLKALQRITSGESVIHSDRSRQENISDDEIVVSAKFKLDEEEIAYLEKLRVSRMPGVYTIQRKASGQESSVLFDRLPARDFPYLRNLGKGLEKKAESLIRGNQRYCNSNELDEESRAEVIQDTLHFVQTINDMCDNWEEASDQEENSIVDLIKRWRTIDPESQIITLLEGIAEWIEDPLSMNRILRYLEKRRPSFLLFDDASRELQSTYVLSEETVTRPPKGLKNLAELADLNLRNLWDAHQNGNQGERSTILLQANTRLESEFAEVWNQSQLAVQMRMEGPVLYVEVKENNATITPFDQRSSGLRMFVSLWAFLKSAQVSVKPILLVDEAELHLHLDAQSDLVQMFTKHEGVANVIYTTHSPGCLPPDLGTGVRVLSVSKENSNWSSMSNSFWASAYGFSPLIMAMGAGASAFSTVKYAALAEGAAEMLMLPTLIRHANELDQLEYQVAPGLSESPKKIYPELDLAAARVAYVVDGDNGGKQLAKGLVKAGIPSSKIVHLRSLTLENILSPDCYAKACEELVKECNPDKSIPRLPVFEQEAGAWPIALEKWCKKNQLAVPSKIAVASRLVESDRAIPSAKGRRALRYLHRDLLAAFQITKLDSAT